MDEEQLRRAFEARDLDGDGVLSLQDLRESTGLSESELHSVFAICQGPEGRGDFLTFEDFAAGFRQYPQTEGSPAPRKPKLEINTEEEELESEEIRTVVESCVEVRKALGDSEGVDVSQSPQVALQGLAKSICEKPVEGEVIPKLSNLLFALSRLVEAQGRELEKAKQSLEEESNWTEAISREHESLKKTCRLLTEKTREFERELQAAATQSEQQTALLRRELADLRRDEEQGSQQLDTVQALLLQKEAEVAQLQREVQQVARRKEFLAQLTVKEDAPSPQVPRTSRVPLKFLFSPTASPARPFRDSLRERQLSQLRTREKDLECREVLLQQRELDIEAACARRCTRLQQENEELRHQLLRERIKCEHYKVMAQEAPAAIEGVVGSLSEELALAAPRESSPIHVRISIPKKPKQRSCWFFR